MRISSLFLVGPLALFAGAMAHGQAATPENHPGFLLANAIAEAGCVLHQDDVNGMLFALELEPQQFPQMAVPLMQDGYLAPSGNGTLTLVNWGLCTGDAPVVTPDGTDAVTE